MFYHWGTAMRDPELAKSRTLQAFRGLVDELRQLSGEFRDLNLLLRQLVLSRSPQSSRPPTLQ
jgi:hypothetical protein